MAKKPEANRSKTNSCFVRMSDEDRDLFERAIDKLLTDVPVPVRMGVGLFLIEAGRRWAKEILGKK